MTVRSFNGTSDFITFRPGATVGVAAPFTMALLVKRLSGTASVGHMLAANNATGSTFAHGTDLWASSTGLTSSLSGASDSTEGTFGLAVADGWVVIALTKASGSVTPTLYKVTLGGSLSSAAGGVAQADPPGIASTAFWEFGRDEFSNHVNYEVALAGAWGAVLASADISGLVANLRSSDWVNSAAGRPLALWQFNQSTVTDVVLDLIQGGANQAAISGTTVVSNDDPAGWAFDLAIPPGPPQTRARVLRRGVRNRGEMARFLARVPKIAAAAGPAVLTAATADTSLTSTACSRVLALPRAASDSSVSGDAAAPATQQPRAVADSSASSTTSTHVDALPRATADTSASATTSTRVLRFPRSTTDTSLTAETATPAKGYARAAADTSLSSDALTRGALIMGRSTADTSTTSDAVARALALPRATADTSASSDAATGRRGTGRTLADSSTTGDAVTRSAQPFTRATADATTSTDAASRTLGLPRGGVDSSTSADTVTRLLRFPRATTDSSLTGDTATRAASASRTAGETSNTTDSATRSTRVTVTLADVSLTFDSATGPQIHPPFVSYPTSAQVTRGAPGRGNTSALVQRGPVDRSTTSSRYNN